MEVLRLNQDVFLLHHLHMLLLLLHCCQLLIQQLLLFSIHCHHLLSEAKVHLSLNLDIIWSLNELLMVRHIGNRVDSLVSTYLLLVLVLHS